MSFGNLLSKFSGMRALVVGDLMLDEYIFGHVSRISPEAPVMVVRQERIQQLPGGAANVALNLKALGAEVSVVGLVGADEAGLALDQALSKAGMLSRLILDAARVTTRKTRIVADHKHQVLRVDHESDDHVSEHMGEVIVDAVLDQARDAEVIVMSDYLKGALPPAVISALIQGLKGKTLVANPKPASLDFYHGVNLVSLNRLEASGALGWAVETDTAENAALTLRERLGVESVLITLGEGGMVAASTDGVFRVAAPRVEVYDTAGAGDTVIATVALGLAAVGFEQDVFDLAAQTAASVVRRVGVATPSAEDLNALR